MFVLVAYADFSGRLFCLLTFFFSIATLTYRSYKLVAHFDLSLDLFQGDFWILSHYSLISKSEQIKWILY